MEHEIILQGDAVLLVERRVLKAVHVEQFTEALTRNAATASGILPRGCIYMARLENRQLLVMETPARVHTIRYGQGSYRLSVPFVQFYLILLRMGDQYELQRVRASCTKQPVRKMDDNLFRLPLPNTNSDGGLCTGRMRSIKGTPQEIAENFAARYWGGAFNDDLSIHFPELHGRSISIAEIIKRWAKLTEENPFFAIEKDTRLTPHTSLTFGREVETCLNK